MTKNIQTVPSWAGPWDGGWLWRPRGPRGLSVAPWNFTEWDTTHGTVREWGASVRAHGLARGGVRACERQCVLEHSWQSFSNSAAPGRHTGSGLHTS